jgi:hypothetical protein
MGISRWLGSSIVVASSAAAVFVACGGDDGGGGGGSNNPDAKVFMDAAVPMDAPAGLSGLGQKCMTGSDCPASAPDCISVKLTSGMSNFYCTPRCVEGGTMTTDGSGSITVMPNPDNAKCVAAYSGGGTGVTLSCSLLTAWMPMDNPPKPSSTYTNVNMGCLIRCGTNMACPAGTTCTSGSCFPN